MEKTGSLRKPTIYTADWHLTDMPRDAYRWDFTTWLAGKIKVHNVKRLVILGDLTDRKDAHGAMLVNRVVEMLHHWASTYDLQVILLRGNHDYIDPSCPYFRFLDAIPGLHYVVNPEEFHIDGQYTLLLPHSREPEHEWVIKPGIYDRVLMHQMVLGVRARSGKELPGINQTVFKDIPWIMSGDIHEPQQIGKVIYVGAPYPIIFGDNYVGRIILEKPDGRLISMHVPAPRKERAVVKSMDALRLKGFAKEDHVSVVVELPREDFVLWPKIREKVFTWAKQTKVVLYGVELQEYQRPHLEVDGPTIEGGCCPTEIFDRFCVARSIAPRMRSLGLSFLEIKDEDKEDCF